MYKFWIEKSSSPEIERLEKLTVNPSFHFEHHRVVAVVLDDHFYGFLFLELFVHCFYSYFWL